MKFEDNKILFDPDVKKVFLTLDSSLKSFKRNGTSLNRAAKKFNLKLERV